MCCVGRGGDLVAETKVGDLTDNEMTEFDERWRNYKKAVGPNSLVNATLLSGIFLLRNFFLLLLEKCLRFP